MGTYDGMSIKEKLSFAIAGFGQNMVITFVSTFMLIYLYEGVGFSTKGIASLTIILTIAKIWDAINDLIMGVLVDRTRSRWGKLRPYILFTAAPIALLTILMFSVPDMKEVYKLLYFGIIYVLWDMVYTMSDVPYWGLTGVLTSNTNERTGLISMSRTAGTIALALITLLGPHMARWFSFSKVTTAQGWSRAAIFTSIIGMSLFTLAFFNTREKIEYSEQRTSIKKNLSTIFQNKPLLLALAGNILSFGRNIVQVGGAVVAFIVFGDEGVFTLLGAAIIAAIIISTIAAPFILKKVPKRTMIISSALLSSVVYFIMYLVGYSNLWAVMVIIFITGLFTGLSMVTHTAMIADTVDYMEYKTGERNEGACFSGLTFASKLLGALATMVFGVAVSLVGYAKGVDITSAMKNGVFIAITIIPAISSILETIPYCFYPLTEKKLSEMMSSILERRSHKEKSTVLTSNGEN